MRITFAFLCLCGLLLAAGCGTKEEGSTAKQQSGAGVSTRQAPPAPNDPSAPPESDDANTGADSTQGEMVDADAKKDDGAADNYPYLPLVTAANEPRLTQVYKACEDELRTSPKDTDQQMQRAYLLFSAGGLLAEQENSDQATLAYQAAFACAQTLVKASPELPPPYYKVLASIYYNGACADALGGKAEQAKATLQQAIEWGWTDMELIRNDPDLASVRALPGFDTEMDSWIETARQAMLKQAAEELANAESFPLDFTVTDLAGAELKLADLKGKVVIVDFWGTWCPPCREEIPSFIKLQSKFGERGLQMIGLNFEQADTDEANAKLAKDFVDANAINYPCALGTDAIMAQVPDFEGFPTTVFLDRTGKVRLKIVGLHDYAYLESLVTTLLDEAAAAPAGE